MTEPDDAAVQTAVDAAETPLEDMDPVEVTEVDDDGEEPPESWGQDGAGHDDPDHVDDPPEVTNGGH